METQSEPTLRALELVKSKPIPERPADIGPFCGYIGLLFFVDFFLSLSLATSSGSELLVSALGALIVGQVALAIIIAGLMGGNWLEGIFLSVIAVFCGMFLIALANGLFNSNRLTNLAFLSTLPLVCLAGASPLILLRWTIGWRLCPQSQLIPPRERLTIEDMVLVPASIVAFCVMAFAALKIDRYEYFWEGMLSSALPVLVLCLLFVLPCTYWAFRVEDGGFRWLLCMGYPLALVIIPTIGIAAFNPFPAVVFIYSVFFTVVASGTSMCGLQLLRSNGYCLTNFARAAVHLRTGDTSETAENNSNTCEPSPFDLEPTTPTFKSRNDPLVVASRKRHRIAVGILLTATAIVNSGTWAYSQIKERQSLARIVADGGTVEMANGKPIRIAFGPSTSDVELEQINDMPSVKHISLAGSKVSNIRFRRNNFASLELLDIRSTQVKIQGISYPYRSSIQILVSEGQFSKSEIQQLTGRGYSVKELAD